MIKITSYILFLLPILVIGQTSKLGIPFTNSKMDSLYFQIEDDSHYNYFYSRIDTLRSLSSDEIIPVVKILVIDTINSNGYLKIIAQNNVLYKYQVKNCSITGLGLHYNALVKKTNYLAFEQGIFLNGKLNGSYLRLDVNNNGSVIANLLYKKGKLHKIIFANDYYGKHKYWLKSHTYPNLDN